MAQAMPWESDPIVGDGRTTGPLASPPARPEKPREAPPGYEWDGSGGMRPVPGGPADPAAPQNQPKPDIVDPAKQEKADRARLASISEIRNTIDLIDKAAMLTAEGEGWWTTGKSGAVVRSMPEVVQAGTDSKTLEGYISTIKANTAINKIMDMKANSPTGAGLGGQTSDRDMKTMEDTIASLEPNQSQADFMASLARSKRAFLDMLGRIDEPTAMEYANKPGIRFNADGSPFLTSVEGPDDRKQEDPFGVRGGGPDGGGPNGNGGGPDRPSIGMDSLSQPRDQSGLAGLGTLAKQGATLGLSDEAAGIGGFLSSVFTGEDASDAYRRERDLSRTEIASARKAWPVAGTALEVLGGGGAARVAAIPGTIMSAAKQGAALGGTGGFGYGEGAGGSAANAMIGATGGAALGAGMQAGANALSRFARPKVAPDMDVIAAGQRQNIPVRQADARPELRGKYAAAESTETAGPMIRSARAADEAAMETRVAEVGGQGNVSDNYALGGKVQEAGKRYIAKTRVQADRLYTKAREAAGGGAFSESEREALKNADYFGGGFADEYAEVAKKSVKSLEKKGFVEITATNPDGGGFYYSLTNSGREALKAGGGFKVTPTNAAAALDTNIAELKAAGENSNAAAIKYLQGLRDDIDQGLTLDSVQNIRTNMRGQISERGLTGTDTDRRVMQVIDAMNDDLTAQLPQEASTALRAADGFYRQRQEFINGTLKEFMGSRGSPLPAETAAQRLVSMAQGKGKFDKFSAMWQQLEKAEQADVAATIASSLGRKQNGDFSAAFLIKNLDPNKGINPRTARLIFGKEGAEALNDLRILAQAKGAAMDRLSPSGQAIGKQTGGVRQLLMSAFGFSQGGVVGAVAAPMAAGFLTKMGEQRAARLLLNPDFTKWLRNAPNTTNPKAIDRYFGKLGGISSIAANDNQAFTKALMDHFAKSPGRAAGEDTADSRRIPPQ